jgi:hypothetical protein
MGPTIEKYGVLNLSTNILLPSPHETQILQHSKQEPNINKLLPVTLCLKYEIETVLTLQLIVKIQTYFLLLYN